MKRGILIYNGYGTTDQSKDMLHRFLAESTNDREYTVSHISPDDICKGEWVKNCALIAFGGGFDKGYVESLGTEGTAIITDFINSGGLYLGICAGAYFACDRFEFDKGGLMEVCEERQLKFFPGVCIGPQFKGFKYNSEQGSRAAMIETNLTKCGRIQTYYNGGGHFCYTGVEPTHNRTEVLGRYIGCVDSEKGDQDRSSEKKTWNKMSEYPSHSTTLACCNEGKSCEIKPLDAGSEIQPTDNTGDCLGFGHPKCKTQSNECSYHLQCDREGGAPAIILCRVGRGLALLSAVHFEFDPDHMDTENEYLSTIMPGLLSSKAERRELAMCVLRLLGISTSKPTTSEGPATVDMT